ncbi:MAG: nickel-dependent hydrogenase large subunit [Rhodocyclaceae bacterium]|nr:nickel-dependent hydrogenase large subunit [Rhodocyclaceae bacterium]
MGQGELGLTVRWHAATRRIAGVDVANRRPQATGLLAGRPLAEAVALAPRLFTLCGGAQGVAARLAAAAAGGRAPAVEAADRLAVAREAAGEHLWRLLLDWPTLSGRPSAKDDFLAWRRRLAAAATPAEHAALGGELRAFAAGLAPPDFPETAPAEPLRLLPWRRAADWAADGVDAAFARAPTFAGGPAETGALARRADEAAVAALLAAGRRIAARVAARIADIHALADGLAAPERLTGWLDAAPAGDGAGLARVETARGLLLHLIKVKDDRVVSYVIVAPTEWNFHPRGAFAGELIGGAAATRDEAAMQARRLALALDPCVGYEVAVEDA